MQPLRPHAAPGDGPARIDHVVVLANTLEQGEAWSRATLRQPLEPGGRHALMGTHNRLLRLDTATHPQAYLEVIAIDPDAPAPGRRRWYDMDDAARRARIAASGPGLVHWVCAVPDIDAARDALHALGLEPGDILDVSRDTPEGRLAWRISVRTDGRCLFDGLLPTLIQWQGPHPVQRMPASPFGLRGIGLRHPEAASLQAALASLGLPDCPVEAGPPALRAWIDAPHGAIELQSHPGALA